MLLGEGDDGIGRPEDIAIFLRMDAQGLHGVLGHQAAELLRQQRPVGTRELIGFDGSADLQAPAIGRRQGAGSDRLRGQGSGTPETQRHQQGEQSTRHSDDPQQSVVGGGRPFSHGCAATLPWPWPPGDGR